LTNSELYNQLTLHFWQEEELVFPETYAGAFLEDDYLIILVTDDSQETLSYYFNILSEDAPIIFRVVNYSYNYLLELGENALYNFTSPIWWGVDILENHFNITLDLNYEASLLEYQNFSLNSDLGTLPIAISFSEQIAEKEAPVMEMQIEEFYYVEEDFQAEELELSPTVIVLSLTFIILVIYSFHVLRKRK